MAILAVICKIKKPKGSFPQIILILRVFTKTLGPRNIRDVYYQKNLRYPFHNILLCKTWDTVYLGFIEYLGLVAFIVSGETIVALRVFFTKTLGLRNIRDISCQKNLRFFWWAQMDSNHRPLRCQRSALAS